MYLLAIVLIALCVSVNANSYLECKVERQLLENKVHQRFSDESRNVLNLCMADRKSLYEESFQDSKSACYIPVNVNPKFKGPCPRVLSELEKSKYVGPDAIVARAHLRNQFRAIDNDHFETYLFDASVAAVQELLNSQPGNGPAMMFLMTSLIDEEDLGGAINLEIKMQRMDPDCSYFWPLRENSISDAFATLLENRAYG